MKLGYIVGYMEGKTPIDFGENRSKVKVTVTKYTLTISEIFGFRMITQSLQPNQIKLGYIVGYQEGKTPIDLKEKIGQRSRSR